MSIIENIRNRSWVREKYEKEKDDCLRIRGRVDRKIVGAIEPGRMADSDDRSCRDVMGGAGSVLGHYDTGRRVDGGVSMEVTVYVCRLFENLRNGRRYQLS